MQQVDWKRQWREGNEEVAAAFSALPPAAAARVAQLAGELVALRGKMQGVVATIDASAHCAACGGACCEAGRFHVSAVDALVYLATGREIFSPLFDGGMCPYLGESGCLMPAGYRPFNCITFNCEVIEDRLAPGELARFYEMERDLRRRYREIRSLFPAGVMQRPLLKG